MQIHIALYRWKQGIPEEKINRVLSQVTALKDKIDGIVEISCTKNKSKYAEGYTHVIFVRGRNAKAIANYRAHPDHIAVAGLIGSMEEKGIGVDFSTDHSS